MTLEELVSLLDDFAAGRTGLEAVHAKVLPVLAADPLDVETSDSRPWDDAHAEARLFWRLIYLVETETAADGALRTNIGRIVGCLRRTGSAELTFELLPMILDQDRFTGIIERHLAGIISRTGLLSVIAESGYPGHVKVWLEHAGVDALARLREALTHERYEIVAAGFDVPPC